MREMEMASLLFLSMVIVLLAGVIFYNQVSSSSAAPSGISISQFELIGIESVNGSGSTLVIQFTITNPAPIGATIENASYDLYADGSYVGHGVVSQPFKIPARGTATSSTDFFLPVTGGFRGTWIYFLGGGEVYWRASGNATVSQSLLGTVEAQFSCTSAPRVNGISCSYILH
jgi:LEA14-like dessication related protein